MTTLLTRRDGTILIISFQDVSIIDESRITAVGNELLELLNKSDTEKVVLNFDNVEFMSSAMIGKLVHFGNRCKEEKVKLRLCQINSNVRKVFDLMRLEKLFDIDADEDTSISKLAHGGWFG